MLRPYKNIPAGEFVKDALDYMGMSQVDFAEILGVSTKTVNDIIKARQIITPEMAVKIAKVLGYDAEYWLGLENDYRIRLIEESKSKESKQIDDKAIIYRNMPINGMRKLGWIKALRNQSEELIKEVKKFLGVEEITDEVFEKKAQLCFRKSENFTQNEIYASIWYIKANECSKNFKVSKFNREALETFLSNVYSYSMKENGIELFLEELNKIGIKFFVLKHLPKTYIDGASFYCNENPVIVYTIRFDRADNFWFTILHELAHIHLNHIDINNGLIENIEDKNYSNDFEKEADSLTLQLLKKDIIHKYFANIQYISTDMILNFSKKNNIHPSIIVGILQHSGIIPYSQFNKLKGKISPHIPSKYVVE